MTLDVSEAATIESCFHCGLPIAPELRSEARISGAWRSFCCAGCAAVACAIVGQGLADYYRLRSSAAGRPATPPDAFTEYDDEAFQQSFARSAPDGMREATLLLEGIRCSACAWLNEQAMTRLPGVESVAVNYATRRALVRWAPQRIQLSEILGAVARIGYRASPYQPHHADAIHASERRAALWRLFVAGFGMMQVMMYAVPAYLAADGTMPPDIAQLMRWASLVLTLPVVGYSAQGFFTGAWRDLRLRRFGIDVPVALGIAVAFGASAWATFRGAGEVWFDSVTMFVFLLLAGRYLELEARRKAADALAHLMRLAPAFAERLRVFPASLECDRVSAAALRPKDFVLVRPGAAVPADGVVVQGESEVDEALLTGESRPRMKSKGSALVGGSINVIQPLVMQVERVGPDTVLAAITRLVERAIGEKQPLAELADRYAHQFVLLVLLLAAATGIVWALIDPDRALWVAVSVLIVTCPCALSLATPVSLTVATGELARRGFIVARGHTIEALARATDIVFDKTGTLTCGEPRITAMKALGSRSTDACVAIAIAVERASEHPIARAFVDLAGTSGTRPLPVVAVANHPGRGVEAFLDGERLRVGNRAFCAELAGSEPTEAELPATGSVVYLAANETWLARFEFGDTLRPGAYELVRTLAEIGKRVHLLSGDNAAAAESIATTVGIRHVRAEADPAAKQSYVRSLQREGALVAMVGDGVNDAPVLALADVSIAMGQGAELAQIQSDAVLLSSDLEQLAEAVRIAQRTLRVIQQNLGWALAYNLIAIPAAATGLVTPWMAGVGMSGSSLAVILNALRLRGRRRASDKF